MAANRTKRLSAPLAMLALAGCATFSTDGGFGSVEQTAQRAVGAQPRWQRTDADRAEATKLVRAKLMQPLSAEDAVQVALVHNPGLQATYSELGIAEADVVAAGRLPAIRIASLRTKRGNDVADIEQSIGIGVLEILTLPLRYQLESSRFARVQADVARATIQVAYDTRRAWVEAVSAQEAVRYMAQVQASAEASAELARRMAAAGNFPRLTQMREQVFYAEATAAYARASLAANAARERLTRLMGLEGADAGYRLPERLPDPPTAPKSPADVAAIAPDERLDIRAARRDADSLARSLGLVQATRFVNAFEVGRARTAENGEPFAYGWDFRIEIPLFDFGTARVAQAEALYMQAVSRITQAAVDAQSELREAYAAYRSTYDAAKHYRDEIVPLRKRISDENQLRYNGMLISVFELLADARAQVSAVSAAIEATREYWLAETDLQAALVGVGGGARSAARRGATPMAAASGGPH